MYSSAVRSIPDRFVEAFVDKLVLLEQKTGAKVHYRVMPPLLAHFQGPLANQAIAKQIAEFIGLTGFTFIIATAKQKEKVGGHIDLSSGGREVFVEVDSDMIEFPEAVAATLCHEACHKWLQVNGLNSPNEHDNEILTDITSVFLGLGKIMLNGCRTTNVRHETIANGTRTITETLTAGYLDRDQLAFVYRLVCAMRSIPSWEFMWGLNSEATLAVQRCDSSYGHHYDPRFHRNETTQGTVTGFENQVVEVQRIMADLDKHGTYIKKCFCEIIDAFLSAGHRKLESLRQKAVAMTHHTELDPALCFLQAIKGDIEVKRLSNEVYSVSQEAVGLLQQARAVARHLSRDRQRFPAPSSVMFNIVTCPQDGTKLRLPENSGDLIATCPICKYRFAFNTSALSFPESSAPRWLTWWKKVGNLMRRKQKPTKKAKGGKD